MITRFARDSLVYLLPTLLSRGLWFFLLPVYTRYLSPEEYGVFELLVILYALLNLTLPLEVTQAVGRMMAEHDSTEEKSRYASTAFFFTAAMFVAYTTAALLFAGPISTLLTGSNRFAAEVRISGVAMLANALFYVVQNQLRWSLAAARCSILSLLFATIAAALSIVLVVGSGLGIAGILVGQLTGSAVATVAGLYLLRDRVPLEWSFEPRKLDEMLRYSAPLVLSSAAFYVAGFADRWMLNAWLDLDDVGVYGVALRFAGIIGLTLSACQAALTPLVFQHYREEETAAKIDRILGGFVAMASSGVCLLALIAAPLIDLYVGREFTAASRLVVLQALAVLLMGAYVFAPGLALAKKTGTIAAINVIAATVNLALNCALIPTLGREGAALATLAGGAVMCVLFFAFGVRWYRVPYRFGHYFWSMAILVVFLVAQGRLDNLALRIAAGAAASAAIVLIAVHREDRSRLVQRLIPARREQPTTNMRRPTSDLQ